MREDKGARCEGCECDARSTGSIFYHCSVLSSLMDPTWARHSITFRHIAQAGGRTHGKVQERASEVSTATHEKERQFYRKRRESGSNHPPENNHSLTHAKILFHQHVAVEFPITSAPECIGRSTEMLLIRTVRNSDASQHEGWLRKFPSRIPRDILLCMGRLAFLAMWAEWQTDTLTETERDRRTILEEESICVFKQEKSIKNNTAENKAQPLSQDTLLSQC